MSSWQLEGFSFLEFSAPKADELHTQFQHMGFTHTDMHQTQPIARYQQQDIVFLVNAAQDCQAARHAKLHGAGACAMGFQVSDVEKAYADLLKKGAKPHQDPTHADHQLPGIEAIGGSVIYLTDAHHAPFAQNWQATAKPIEAGAGLQFIDHLTHNVHRGRMDTWADFYNDLFQFKQIRYFDIEGQKTGLISRALASPNGQIKIPLNESKDSLSQIEEFLNNYHGEGIQHIALHTQQIYQTVETLRAQQLHFLDVPDTYYEAVTQRVPWHQESVAELQALKILMDGELDPKQGLLLQIFTENTFGPVFFEVIQRKGNQGFGEGNFKALFEAIERDQIKRGTLS
ncbi:MAG: 4-hydroxyphenylpyruvate dioxygenase [Gammaproteobacteria bacterium]|nr:4-hydroxyphenylpyruvate dioxygenase [Gammaproteobacteria bacterium]